jgi:hypothetical protein
MGVYRVLYAATQRLATFVECLAYFRPDSELTAELAAIVAGDDGDEPQPAGVVPRERASNRCVGSGQLIGHPRALAIRLRAVATRRTSLERHRLPITPRRRPRELGDLQPTGPGSQTSEELEVDDGDLHAVLALHGLALG